MKAMLIDEFGGSERLRLAHVPRPEPAPGEVLIEVACTSVNPVDWKIREGMLADLLPHAFPLIPGWDAAGIVAAVGAGTSRLRVGERVYAYCRKSTVQFGTYAEYVAVPETFVAPMPESLSFVEAAAIPLTGLTAWQALFDFAGLAMRQTLFVSAGAGGVGGLAIQFAKHALASLVVSTGRVENHPYMFELGAGIAVDYQHVNVLEVVAEQAPGGVDVVMDCVGGSSLTEACLLARTGGVVVSIVDEPDQALLTSRGVRSGFVFVEPNGEQLGEIGALIDAGRVRPPAVEEMDLEDAALAMDRNQDRHVRGKIVLRVNDRLN